MASILGQPGINPYGAGMANALGAMYLQNQFGKYLDSAQQQPINIDALRGISDPRIMQMAAQMLIANQRAQQGAGFGVQPGGFQYLTPEERRAYMVSRITGAPGTGTTDSMDEFKKAQAVIDAGTEQIAKVGKSGAPILDKDGSPIMNTRIKEGHEGAVAAARRRIRELGNIAEKPAAQEALRELLPLQREAQKSLGQTKRLAEFVKKLNKLPPDTQKKIGQLFRSGRATMEEIISAVENE